MSNYDNMLDRLSTEPPWPPRNEAAILEPFTYVTSTPGKEIRGQLIDAFNMWLNVPKEKLVIITKVVNMLHAASLLVDDIEDDSHLRRGQPVAHRIYGIPQTINTANYVYFLAYQELFKLRDQGSGAGNLDFIVTEELLSLHRGQGLEILWRDSLSCPSEEDYIAMVNNKTGGLLRIGIKLMMACASNNLDMYTDGFLPAALGPLTDTSYNFFPVRNYVPLVNLIGVYFQIRDDLMNLESTEYTKNKGFAEDLTEGKFSFPLVHAIHADKTNRQVLNILQKRPSSPTLKTFTIEYLRNRTKSFEYTHSVLQTLESQIRQEIAKLGGNRSLEQIVDILHVDPSPAPTNPA